MNFSFKSLFAFWSLSPQRFHCYFYLSRVFLAVSEILNHSDTCAVPSVCNAVGLLILLKLCQCPVFTFLQQLMTNSLWVIYTCTCSPMFSIDVVASAPDDPNLQNVFNIRKYVMQLSPAGPVFWRENIRTHSRRVHTILQNWHSFIVWAEEVFGFRPMLTHCYGCMTSTCLEYNHTPWCQRM